MINSLIITHTTPTGNILEAPELGTPRYKVLVPSGVHYSGVQYCTLPFELARGSQ